MPEVTLYFWIIKVLATTVGETAGTTATSIVFLTTILALVFYLAVTRRDRTPALEPA
ncbi:MAG: hypothetical protein KJ051_00895 [Thermoleophilia bacterium]|nr:hypothetical protein [Thermoleophilia bacterium]